MFFFFLAADVVVFCTPLLYERNKVRMCFIFINFYALAVVHFIF